MNDPLVVTATETVDGELIRGLQKTCGQMFSILLSYERSENRYLDLYIQKMIG